MMKGPVYLDLLLGVFEGLFPVLAVRRARPVRGLLSSEIFRYELASTRNWSK